jgi:hypothetical protein
MIAVYLSSKDTIYLDATGKNHPFKLPTNMIQGKEALIGLDTLRFLVRRVPFATKGVTTELDSVTLDILSNNRIQGTGYYRLSGYQKISLLNYLDKKSYDLRKNYLRSLLEKGNNKFKLDTFYIEQQDLEKPLVLHYKFTLPDFFTQSNNLTFINLNFLNDYFDRMSTVKRKNVIDFAYTTTLRLSVTVNLGPTQTADFIPGNVSFNNRALGFDMAYRKLDNAVHFTNSIYIHQPTFYLQDFKEIDYIISNYKKNKSNLVSLTFKD